MTHLLPISSFENICNKTAINLPLFNAVTIDNNDNEICNIGINYHISKNNLSARELGMLALFNGMLTGIKNSILFQKLRKEQRLIYHISSYPTLTQNICLFKIYTKTTKFNKSIVVDIIKKEINAIYRNGISNETIFKQSKRRVVNEMILKLENDKADMIKQLAKSDLFRTPTYMEIINELGNVSLNELNRFLKSDILFKNQCSIFID
ncbi:insulinase family protein [Streptococcus didelphis]|uniref:Insulinase family protein n=1 Tax=Streptococcus didelphis TaxID=102886 RepID=A0ABY9LI32_9STRE|nr:insulinase family protein [Streptococcus didelphis]WMB28499.1 insulinase family protein [Streptococcus didelphis]WMB29175.1 insulinase family protein [Streptococcus didelphis]